VGFNSSQARLEVKDLLDKAALLNFPPTWEDIDDLIVGQKQIIVKELQRGSMEWSNLEARFKLTMPNAKISSIKRIQNRKLWKQFQNEKEELKIKHGKDPEIQVLFHGTSGTDPSMIYTGEEGFDMRFSSGGMWGQAVYFAVNSSYSNNYSFKGAGGRQMFMANVLLGTY